MTLSKKQKEVMAILRNGKDHKFHWIGGLKPRCFISHDLNYKVSTATAFKLMEMGLIKPDDEKTINQTLLLTELGKTIVINATPI